MQGETHSGLLWKSEHAQLTVEAIKQVMALMTFPWVLFLDHL
jgi:hypothetical protein